MELYWYGNGQPLEMHQIQPKKREVVLLYYHYTQICLYDYGAILNKMHVFGGLLFQKKIPSNDRFYQLLYVITRFINLFYSHEIDSLLTWRESQEVHTRFLFSYSDFNL